LLAGVRRSAFKRQENAMSVGLVSFAAGVLIGVMYALLKVRSPAPPAIALVGLLGMLMGEQLVSALITQAAAG